MHRQEFDLTVVSNSTLSQALFEENIYPDLPCLCYGYNAEPLYPFNQAPNKSYTSGGELRLKEARPAAAPTVYEFTHSGDANDPIYLAPGKWRFILLQGPNVYTNAYESQPGFRRVDSTTNSPTAKRRTLVVTRKTWQPRLPSST